MCQLFENENATLIKMIIRIMHSYNKLKNLERSSVILVGNIVISDYEERSSDIFGLLKLKDVTANAAFLFENILYY